MHKCDSFLSPEHRFPESRLLCLDISLPSTQQHLRSTFLHTADKMLKIWSMVRNSPCIFGLLSSPSHFSPSQMLTCLQKQKQQQDANADAAAGTKRKKVTAAQLRVQKGMSPAVAPCCNLESSPADLRPRSL